MIKYLEQPYLDLLADVLNNGTLSTDRTGVGTLAVFGRQLRFDINEYFPAVTTKKLAFKAVVGELLWMLEGSGDERRLAEITHGTRDGVVTIWTPNALAPYWKPKAKFEGDLGRVYGMQWRYWRGPKGEIDQVASIINALKNDPSSRRIMLSAWNVGELDQMALPPCHCFAQFNVRGNALDCLVYVRSNDLFLGAPFNIAQYSLLTYLLAHVTDLVPGELVYTVGNAHIYTNHIEQVREQLDRFPFPSPTLWLNPAVSRLEDFTMDDVRLEGYRHHNPIKAEMAV
jgi:thymidylate synthase